MLSWVNKGTVLIITLVVAACLEQVYGFHLSFPVQSDLVGTITSRNHPYLNTRDGVLFADTTVVEPKEPVVLDDEDIDDDDDDDDDTLYDLVTEKLGQVEGLWYSDDFYGVHGREWVQISAKLVGSSATSAMEAIKITGDPHVPAGCVTWRTLSWPAMGGRSVPAQIHVRANPADPNGFSWLSGELTLVSQSEIYLVCHYTPKMKSGGTFYKKTDNEDQDDN